MELVKEDWRLVKWKNAKGTGMYQRSILNIEKHHQRWSLCSLYP